MSKKSVLVIIVLLIVFLYSGKYIVVRENNPTNEKNSEDLVINPVIESGVQYCFERGLCIAIIQVENPDQFHPTGGGTGTRCIVGQQSVILRQGKKEYGWELHCGQQIFLYPHTDEKTVILLNHTDGNWIKYSEANENTIKRELKRLDELRAVAPAPVKEESPQDGRGK